VLTDTLGVTYDIERDVWTAPPETVEEATEADLLLHVVDGARPDAPQRRMAVEQALRGSGQAPARMLSSETRAIDAGRV
jgi:GTP-binding protein HflX